MAMALAVRARVVVPVVAGSLCLGACSGTVTSPASSTHAHRTHASPAHPRASRGPSASRGASASHRPSTAGRSTAADARVAANNLQRGFPVTSAATSRRQLASLTVADQGPLTGFSRDEFPHWRDASTWGWPVAPGNDCNSRNAALYRDGDGVRVNASCTVTAGHWTDPYTARTYTSRASMDIDHLVPLAAAWRAGAASWSTTRRTQYANDPLVLVSAQDRANEAKGDKTPDLWKPPNHDAWCLYAQRWTAVKAKYALTVTATERTALTAMLATCQA